MSEIIDADNTGSAYIVMMNGKPVVIQVMTTTVSTDDGVTNKQAIGVVWTGFTAAAGHNDAVLVNVEQAGQLGTALVKKAADAKGISILDVIEQSAGGITAAGIIEGEAK